MDFIEEYLSYCDNNECPPTYHLFTGLTVLAGLTGRRIWVDQGYWNYYGNLYTVLVGPAGNGKSVAAMIGIKLLEATGDVPTSSECCSPRKLLEEMASFEKTEKLDGEDVTYSNMVALPDELSNFVSQADKLMLDTLTAVWYRNVHRYSTSHHGSFTVKGPCLTLLTCAVPEWITTNLRGDVISGGFSRRCLWIYEESRLGKVVPPSKLVETPKMRAIWPKLVARCRDIQKIKGRFFIERDAEAYIDDWYVKEKAAEKLHEGGYAESKPGFVMKLAMLLALSEEMEKVVRIKYVDRALEYLAIMEKNMHKVFEGMGRNELHGIAGKVMGVIEFSGNGGMPESRIKGFLFKHATSREGDEILNHLVRTKRLVFEQGKYRIPDKTE